MKHQEWFRFVMNITVDFCASPSVNDAKSVLFVMKVNNVGDADCFDDYFKPKQLIFLQIFNQSR